ncbi:hypothetical protein L2K70_08950 [Nocardioides KLBMP 9356]|uniref:Uncharacterized protein n=1 Tax=Nocardioides potassii TaxID=2911371 RepID=A0ABS9H935_9ACTN|nr:hypothetical protein [Nocardioides potassii]MCF6377732.1 hypothetical protein [Nocardioides potassii]
MRWHRRRHITERAESRPDERASGGITMWDTVETNTGRGSVHLSHDLPCSECGHARHTYLPCSDTCACTHDRALSAV